MRKARELLTFLAVHPDGVSRELISEALWPETGTSHAATQRNLALRKARELLRTASGTTAPMWIIHTSGRYHLDPTLISTDLQDFQDALDEARRAASTGTRLA
jgi:two-component SAPR family response regulator